MAKLNVVPIAEKMVEAVRAYVAKSEASMVTRLDALEARLAALPTPEKGEKGDRGEDGESVHPDTVRAMIDDAVSAEVEKRVAALPKAKDGESVHPDTIALMVREAADKLVAAMPKPKDGRDGFGLEDFDISLEGRTLTMSFMRGDLKVDRQLRVPFLQDCGVYKPQTKYEKGDGVTFGGHYWIAKKDEPEFKPGDPADNQGGEPTCWRMAVRRGRDGKDKK